MATIQINKKDSIKVEYNGVIYAVNIYHSGGSVLEYGRYIKKERAIAEAVELSKRIM